MDRVQVFSPGSVANVGCGFDTFGFAIDQLGDILTLEKRSDQQLVIKEIKGAVLPLEPDKNIATVAIASLLKAENSDQGFDIIIEKLIPPGSGLGSSACSANAAVFAVNELMGFRKSKIELIPFALKGEMIASQNAHADNIAPSMLGGFRAVRSYVPYLDIFQIHCPEELTCLLVFPQVEIKTSEARKLISESLSIDQARQQWGNVAGLTTGLLTSNWDLIARSMEDVVAEPYRQKLIPHYEKVKSICLESGAVGMSISGSGPAMFAFYTDEKQAEQPIRDLERLYTDTGIACHFHITKINNEGTRVLS